jgi:hypothetical protein
LGTRISTPKSKSALVKTEQQQELTIGQSFSKGFDLGAKKRVKELNAKGYLIEWKSINDSQTNRTENSDTRQ